MTPASAACRGAFDHRDVRTPTSHPLADHTSTMVISSRGTRPTTELLERDMGIAQHAATVDRTTKATGGLGGHGRSAGPRIAAVAPASSPDALAAASRYTAAWE